MYIPFIYVLFIAEATLLFLVISIILGIVVYRNAHKKPTQIPVPVNQKTINPGHSYIELLDRELTKNTTQTAIVKNSEISTDQQTPATSITHSELLTIRDLFLNVERTAAEHASNDIIFWDKILTGIKHVANQLKTTETIINTVVNKKIETKEKVFYIETQGKKIDGEVNRLKDIIFDQENTLSDLIKSLKKTEDQAGDAKNSIGVTELRAQLGNFERQVRDSKTCMDVLELENNRLQSEINKMQAEKATSADNSEASDVQSMRDTLEKQKQQISSLSQAIDDLKLATEQSEKIKSTLNDFARSSQEMMSCITILEEENERLTAISAGAGAEATGDNPVLKAQIKKLEEELIKKNVAYAKLQDEFSSVEKEYLSMYNAMHGDNS